MKRQRTIIFKYFGEEINDVHKTIMAHHIKQYGCAEDPISVHTDDDSEEHEAPVRNEIENAIIYIGVSFKKLLGKNRDILAFAVTVWDAIKKPDSDELKAAIQILSTKDTSHYKKLRCKYHIDDEIINCIRSINRHINVSPTITIW